MCLKLDSIEESLKEDFNLDKESEARLRKLEKEVESLVQLSGNENNPVSDCSNKLQDAEEEENLEAETKEEAKDARKTWYSIGEKLCKDLYMRIYK